MIPSLKQEMIAARWSDTRYPDRRKSGLNRQETHCPNSNGMSHTYYKPEDATTCKLDNLSFGISYSLSAAFSVTKTTREQERWQTFISQGVIAMRASVSV